LANHNIETMSLESPIEIIQVIKLINEATNINDTEKFVGGSINIQMINATELTTVAFFLFISMYYLCHP